MGGTRRPLDDSWKRWLNLNLARGCDPLELAVILTQHGFSQDSIRDHLFQGSEPGARHAPRGSLVGLGERDYRAIARPRLTYDCVHPAVREIDTEKLQLYILDDFLSSAECDELIEVINRHLRPSTTTTSGDDPRFRTSQTADLSLVDEPIVAAIDGKIARTLGIRAAYSEGIQAQRYDVGQEFKEHTDYFDRGSADYDEYTADAGNRTWTFMVYLNDGMEGGSTRFPAIDIEFEPRKGRALVWNNRYVDGRPNPDTLHSGTPVTQGIKIIITKWFREKGTGPLFHS